MKRLHVPVLAREDVIRHLAGQEAHWREGYSAQELATAWCNARGDFPRRVRSLLSTVPEYHEIELIDGFFEREVELDRAKPNSQTDLMLIAGLGNELGVIAVEGKAEESFADTVSTWNTTLGKQARLEGLCHSLQLEVSRVGPLRYQLLHRTASAIYEARRYRCRHALMLVHSFSKTHRWFKDFARFAHEMQIPVSNPDSCSPPRLLGNVSLRLGWVSDQPATKQVDANIIA